MRWKSLVAALVAVVVLVVCSAADQGLGDQQRTGFFGWLRASGEGRLTMGASYRLRKQNARLQYALVVDPDGWDDAIHFITYSWTLKPSGPAVGRMFGAP